MDEFLSGKLAPIPMGRLRFQAPHQDAVAVGLS